MIMRISMPNRFRLKKVMGFRTMIRPERGEIHYIGGADILPAPLSLKEETEALNKFGTEEEKEAKSELIEHNLRLVVYIAKKFDNTSVGVEDLISIGTIGLIKAINTFNPTKNIKLATYASRCIENEILMYLRRTSKMKLEVSIDEPLNVDWDGNELGAEHHHDLVLGQLLQELGDIDFVLLQQGGTQRVQITALQQLQQRLNIHHLLLHWKFLLFLV